MFRTIVLFVDKHVSAVEAEETLCAESGVESEITAMDLAFQVACERTIPPRFHGRQQGWRTQPILAKRNTS